MAITIYRSTDTSAPILTGQAGKMAGLLDACLVDGYPNAVKASLGWSRAYTGTNLRSYRMAAGSQSYLAIDDVGTTTCRVRGFRTMTAAGPAVANGSNPWPSEAQVAGGCYWIKSTTADAVARPWVLISNGTIIYIWVDNGSTGIGSIHAFGDMSSYNLTDTNPCILISMISDLKSRFPQVSSINTTCTVYSHLLATKYDGLTQSQPFGKIPMKGMHGLNDLGAAAGVFLQYPDPVNGGLILTPIYIHETAGAAQGVLRGQLPGVQAPCSAMPFTNLDTVTGTAGTDLEGRTFEAFLTKDDAANCCILFETSDTQNSTRWR